MIQDEEGIPIGQQRLIFAGKHLENERILHQCKIQRASELTLLVQQRGGGASFVDVKKELALRTLSWNQSAPKWRVACRGLNIEGICTNEECKAHMQMVVCRLENTVRFDLMKQICCCPLCHRLIKPVKPGFSSCWWRVRAVKSDGTQVATAFRKVGDAYMTYDEAAAGAAIFLHLIIEIRPLAATVVVPLARTATARVGVKRERDEDQSAQLSTAGQPAPRSLRGTELPLAEHCGICFLDMVNDATAGSLGVSLLRCGHVFHTPCIDRWCAVAPGGPSCPYCRAALDPADVQPLESPASA
jgi:hypothetical protein